MKIKLHPQSTVSLVTPDDYQKVKLPLLNEWTAALRSGTYPQTTCQLHNFRGFCCLGVLCEVERIPSTLDGNRWLYGQNSTACLPVESRLHPILNDWGYLPPGCFVYYQHTFSHSLATINDSSALSFNDIATVLEHLFEHQD
jgi:hypothetical protein